MAAFVTFLIFYSLGITIWATWRILALKEELQRVTMALRLHMAQGHDQ